MTVSTTTAVSGPFTCNGSTDFFDYTFKVMDTADLVLTLTNTTTGVDTIVSSSDYTATKSDTGGRCTFTTAPASGQTLTISRSTPRTQATNLENLGTIQPSVLEDGLDKLTLIVQDSQQLSANAIVVPESDADTLSKTLPTAELRKGKLLGFKATTGEPEATTGRVLSGTGSASALGAGATPTVTVTFTESSGVLDIALGIPAGATGSQGPAGTDGTDGIFSAIASKAEAEAGTNNTKGMSPLRTKEAITFNAASVSNAAFYGFKKSGATLQVDVTTAGGSESFTLSDYDDCEVASLGLSYAINASGNLIVTTP
jgi:hypothetical protein